MSKTTRDILIGIGILICAGIALYILPKDAERVYNCSIAEISPDIPVKVKHECCKLRMDKI